MCLTTDNPLVWIAARKLTMESEKACDDYVVDDTGCSLSYAENLLWLVKSISGNSRLQSAQMLGHRSQLSQRIDHILNADSGCYLVNRSSSIPILVMAALLAAPYSSLSFSVKVEKSVIVADTSILVKFFPKGSAEFHEFMIATGK
ncbi:MAG TPA: hypothetical protein DCM64_11130 [Gammaproteobacteria bacterium]|nr:hypothetical protein [Gammaproteobacteria bacterium]